MVPYLWFPLKKGKIFTLLILYPSVRIKSDKSSCSLLFNSRTTISVENFPKFKSMYLKWFLFGPITPTWYLCRRATLNCPLSYQSKVTMDFNSVSFRLSLIVSAMCFQSRSSLVSSHSGIFFA